MVIGSTNVYRHKEDLLIGIPSAKIVKAIAFFASEKSDVTDAKRGTS